MKKMSLIENSLEKSPRIIRKKYIRVAVNTAHPTFMSFAYAIPYDQKIMIGDVVHVPFGRLVLLALCGIRSLGSLKSPRCPTCFILPWVVAHFGYC